MATGTINITVKAESRSARCATCMYFIEKAVARFVGSRDTVMVGRCRRHAPAHDGFPEVLATEWCGDHAFDEAKS